MLKPSILSVQMHWQPTHAQVPLKHTSIFCFCFFFCTAQSKQMQTQQQMSPLTIEGGKALWSLCSGRMRGWKKNTPASLHAGHIHPAEPAFSDITSFQSLLHHYGWLIRLAKGQSKWAQVLPTQGFLKQWWAIRGAAREATTQWGCRKKFCCCRLGQSLWDLNYIYGVL